MQCITVSYGLVVGKAKDYPYFQPAIYNSCVRKDGVRIWKYERHVNIKARRSQRLAYNDAIGYAVEKDIPYLPHVRNNNNVYDNYEDCIIV